MGKENPDWDKVDAKFIAEFAGLVVVGSALSLGEFVIRKTRQKVPFLPSPKEKPLDNSTYKVNSSGQMEHVSADGKVLRRFTRK